MNPELTGFALGLLLGAAKVMTIGTVGFGIAWWRSRRRIRELEADLLEAEQLSAAADEDRLQRVEDQLIQLTSQLDRLTGGSGSSGTTVPRLSATNKEEQGLR